MHRRELLTAAATVTASAVAGCLGSGENDSGRLDLTVRNDGDEAVDIDVVVRGDDGTLYAEETDRIDPGVARAFEVTVDATGRHEVVVTGGDWEGRLAWDAAVCALYDGTVAVDAGTVSTAGECVDTR
ncbi:hypothetical protein [Halorubrum lacusprofundi]|jgi:hypothetical protein|uniref:Uncharacterized protein n=1 Tax=Halorubrum lacusprofundi (strain ATCC 49239 / DSM 5036 / JCM 8891 / ACAM 34) TaxID=416348 RepID=B9LMK0_HALLT|nr:hypothetical protein [Halorubrum lacusprofundi]ACM56588.1 hypothetical protein Hlac_0991 [Halorubrum lacusprofundi ATCC 49239]MCG1005145.1 hypothetical protein [Halorubrum lacusprofundi]